MTMPIPIEIGFIGMGFVGNAVYHGFSKAARRVVIDPKLGSESESYYALSNCIVTFVSVPTPSVKGGDDVDTTILCQVLDSLMGVKYSGLVVIKSTVTPYHLTQLVKDYKDLRIAYNPEFLTEKKAVNDFLTSKTLIIGVTTDQDGAVLEDVYINASTLDMWNMKTVRTDPVTASLIKYTVNTYLATKVAWMNQLYWVHKRSGSTETFEKFMSYVTLDPRIGPSHNRVPGDHGFGFSGTCFPKDTNAFMEYAEKIGSPMTILEEVIRYNDDIRRLRKD